MLKWSDFICCLAIPVCCILCITFTKFWISSSPVSCFTDWHLSPASSVDENAAQLDTFILALMWLCERHAARSNFNSVRSLSPFYCLLHVHQLYFFRIWKCIGRKCGFWWHCYLKGWWDVCVLYAEFSGQNTMQISSHLEIHMEWATSPFQWEATKITCNST